MAGTEEVVEEAKEEEEERKEWNRKFR